MVHKRDQRWIWVVGIALFCVGFTYGVYQSFRSMHDAPGADRVLPQSSEPNLSGLDGEGVPEDSHILDHWTGANGSEQARLDDLAGRPGGATSQDDSSLTEGNEDVFYLGIHQNRVAVFEGSPSEGRLLRVTSRPVDTLPPREVTSLQGGIRVVGEREMLKALEGYMQ